MCSLNNSELRDEKKLEKRPSHLYFVSGESTIADSELKLLLKLMNLCHWKGGKNQYLYQSVLMMPFPQYPNALVLEFSLHTRWREFQWVISRHCSSTGLMKACLVHTVKLT